MRAVLTRFETSTIVTATLIFGLGQLYVIGVLFQILGIKEGIFHGTC